MVLVYSFEGVGLGSLDLLLWGTRGGGGGSHYGGQEENRETNIPSNDRSLCPTIKSYSPTSLSTPKIPFSYVSLNGSIH